MFGNGSEDVFCAVSFLRERSVVTSETLLASVSGKTIEGGLTPFPSVIRRLVDPKGPPLALIKESLFDRPTPNIF